LTLSPPGLNPDVLFFSKPLLHSKKLQRGSRMRWVNPLLRNPTTEIVGCCALAASGHAIAAPPSSVMNSRRLMLNMELPSPPRRAEAASHDNCQRRAQAVVGAG
jgi:hypothetical protein